ncbi:MAG TPA: helix-turn-helix domain-containing protein [Hanamia sp.]|nr:helix-turn-helix domain-containing protein [Hanamia sp.]
MNWKVIKTEREHKKAVKWAMEIFHAEPNTPEDDELGVLLLLIKDYEDRTVKMPEIDVLEVIKEKMTERGMKAKDLEPIIGSKGHVSSILSGRREITLKMAQRLKDYFHLPAEIFLHTA